MMQTLLIISATMFLLSGIVFGGFALWAMNNGIKRMFDKKEFLIKGWQPQINHFEWSCKIFMSMLFITLIISYLKDPA